MSTEQGNGGLVARLDPDTRRAVLDLFGRVRDVRVVTETVVGDVASEAAARIAADQGLQTAIDTEEGVRATADAVLQGNIDDVESAAAAALTAHLDDSVDAHDASAISYDGSGNTSLVQAWLTANNLQTAVGQLAGQLYSPDAETTEALIAALNALIIADPDVDGITNADLFSSDLIVARHLASASVTAGKIDAQAVTAGTLAAGAVTAGDIAAGAITAADIAAYAITSDRIATDAIRSEGYVPEVTLTGTGSISFLGYALTADTGTFTEDVVGCVVTIEGAGVLGADWEVEVVSYDSPTQISIFAPAPTAVSGANWTIPLINGFAFVGSAFDLANGHISTPGLSVDGASGDVAVRGDLEARSFGLLDELGLTRSVFVTGATEQDPSGTIFSNQTANNKLVFSSTDFTGNAPTDPLVDSALLWNNDSGGIMLQTRNGNPATTAATIDNMLFLRPDGNSGLHSVDRTSNHRAYSVMNPEAIDSLVLGANLGQTRIQVKDGEINIAADVVDSPSAGTYDGPIYVKGAARFQGDSATFDVPVTLNGQLQFASATDRIYKVGSNMVQDTGGEYQFWASGTKRATIGNQGIYTDVDGSAANPSLAWGGDTNTGFYRLAENVIGFATGGNNTAELRTQSFRINDGSADYPAFAFISDSDTGMFRVSTNTIGFATAGIEQFRVTTSGRTYAVSYLFYSDRRLKGEVEPFVDGLELVKKLNPVTYRRRWAEQEDPDSPFEFSEPTGERRGGLIADEVEKVAPWAVDGEATESDLQSVDYATLVVPLIAAVKELSARVEALEARRGR